MQNKSFSQLPLPLHGLSRNYSICATDHCGHCAAGNQKPGTLSLAGTLAGPVWLCPCGWHRGALSFRDAQEYIYQPG